MSLAPSSPRLPSPPPPTEIQIGTKSPSISSEEPAIEQSTIDANASRRIHPGTKSSDMAAGPPLVPLNELDSAFQLQEHLKALHYNYTRPSSEEGLVPISRETALVIAVQPEGLDKALWLYELCRFLINKCNDLITGFLFDDPPCSAFTCPEMRASEWQFLCAVHESPKSCCAIDYCCHTLDWATNIVTSQKIFPSRLSLAAGDAVDDRGAGVKHLTNIFRRLHRIFAHAWFQHREVFWRVEGQTGLYVLFKTVCDNYDLLPAENYKLPPEAEGLEPVEETKAPTPAILKAEGSSDKKSAVEEEFLSVGRNNTRRHVRQSPSVGSAVTTVLESDEEDPDTTQKLDETEETQALRLGDSGTSIVQAYEVDEDEEQAGEVNEPGPDANEVELVVSIPDDATKPDETFERISLGSTGNVEKPTQAETVDGLPGETQETHVEAPAPVKIHISENEEADLKEGHAAADGVVKNETDSGKGVES